MRVKGGRGGDGETGGSERGAFKKGEKGGGGEQRDGEEPIM